MKAGAWGSDGLRWANSAGCTDLKYPWMVARAFWADHIVWASQLSSELYIRDALHTMPRALRVNATAIV